jgi:hypothetical protein
MATTRLPRSSGQTGSSPTNLGVHAEVGDWQIFKEGAAAEFGNRDVLWVGHGSDDSGVQVDCTELTARTGHQVLREEWRRWNSTDIDHSLPSEPRCGQTTRL